jgi:hypothetical protein
VARARGGWRRLARQGSTGGGSPLCRVDVRGGEVGGVMAFTGEGGSCGGRWRTELFLHLRKVEGMGEAGFN